METILPSPKDESRYFVVPRDINPRATVGEILQLFKNKKPEAVDPKESEEETNGEG